MTPVESDARRPPPCVALLTNAGVIPRSGPHRMNVYLARKFAQMGIPSIRFDLSGLGDSVRASGSLPVIDQWVADTRAAMDEAQAKFACDRFVMVGFCSGAEVAHHVALEDPRLRAAVIWDLYSYPTLQSRLRAVLYRLKRVGINRLFPKLLARLRRSTSRGNAAQAHEVEMPVPPPRDEFAGQVQTLVDRGVELHFAFSGGHLERFNHETQFKSMFAGYAFANQVAFTYLDRADHVLTQHESRQRFVSMVSDWLTKQVLPKVSMGKDAGPFT